MATEHDLSERQKALPAERQRAVLSLMRRGLFKVLEELARRDTGNLPEEKERLEALVETLLAERDVIRKEVEALLDSLGAIDRKEVEALLDSLAASHPETASGLGYADSIHPKAAGRPPQEPKTLLDHRGSIAVSDEQDFSAIRQYVIDHHVREGGG
jgi:hypothetical protein